MANATNTQIESISAAIKEKAENINFLIIDPLEENLLSLSSLLEDESRTIFTATNGNDALKIANDSAIAIIFLSVQMPGMNASEVVQLLIESENTKNTSIIFITEVGTNLSCTINGTENNIVDYLQRPFDVAVLKARTRVFEKLYRQNKELNKYIAKSEKITKQLNEFVYIVSHDLKAPLRGLTNLSEFLKEELKTKMTPEIDELLQLIQGRGDRMQKLIEGVLHFSRMSNNSAEKENINLNELVNKIIDLIDIPSHIKIEYPDNLPALFEEKNKFREVIQNLIANGVQYNNKESGYVKISCADEQKHYKFSVEDNGMGIKQEHFGKIFGLFQTLQSKDKHENVGIGLTVVKMLVEQRGGEIWLESEFGKGTTFHFTWPKN